MGKKAVVSSFKSGMFALLLLFCSLMISKNVQAATEYTSGDWKYTLSDREATLVEYTGDSLDIVIPSELDGYPVTVIEGSLFKNSLMKTVTIPESIEEIGYQAFYNCEELSVVKFNAINCKDCHSNGGTFYNAGQASENLKIIFGPQVKRIPANLFYVDSNTSNVKLTSVSISDSVKEIGECAFLNCFDLETVSWGNAIEIIGSSAFANCETMTSLVVPETVTKIGYDAFYDCQNLSSIKFNAINCENCYSGGGTFYNAGAQSENLSVIFGGKVKVIPSDLFYVDAGYDYGDGTYAHIRTLKLTDSIKEIGESAFLNCFDLETVSWGNAIEIIGESAFSNCKSMTSLVIPETVTKIGYDAFYDCQNLSSIKFNAINCENCYSGGGTFYNAGVQAGNLSVTFGGKVKVIPSNLFYVNTGYDYGDGTYAHIKTLKLTNSIKEISEYAFLNCFDLKSITIPKNVSLIGYRAFSNCINLKTAGIYSKNAEINRSAFEYCKSDLTFKCYRNSSAAEFAKENGFKISYLDLAKVDISSVNNTSSGIKISWKKVSGATGYYVYRKNGSGETKKIKTIDNGRALNYTDTAVKSKNGTTYSYTVKAFSSSKTSASCTYKKIVRMTGINISKVQNQSKKSIYLKWGKNSKATGYQIQYSTSGKFSKSKIVTISGSNNVSKKITALTKGKKYYVRVRCYKTVNKVKYYSVWSKSKSVKISK